MTTQLTQPELEQLSTYLDGELSPSEAASVQRKLASDAAWQAALRDLQALDGLLDRYAAPAPAADLAARIVAAAHADKRPSRLIRFARLLTPLAAAAAVALAVALYWPAARPANAPGQADQLVIQNLDFFKNYESLETISKNASVVDDDTLAAIEQIETQDGI